MMEESDEMKYAEMFSKWYSWGSPVGIGIFFISLAISALLICTAVKKLLEIGVKGSEIELQIKKE
ncbi:hypothetical protein LEP1GSC050_2769 [Leptospira broomii serovar Hurstbridge str. 5399]|uniref:Uncharacterized protein n=1 Tax=Leptospira broomii serovar Hurstbridge str. 5399 TaxID=1049789 RepID=T0F903_9LEPT|nr:hypothetical protein [Leptospira broomii]EQA43997.1 hypothetical protein LEP1GSC050_2769 [Leptospira broomii serovar Hurstbridge str. 5399]